MGGTDEVAKAEVPTNGKAEDGNESEDIGDDSEDEEEEEEEGGEENGEEHADEEMEVEKHTAIGDKQHAADVMVH